LLKISFAIGGAFSAIGIIYFYLRLQRIRKSVDESGPVGWNLVIRCWISALIDNDDPGYTIIKMAAQSFLFLGGLQLNYQAAFTAILIVFGLESLGDSARVLLALGRYSSIDELVVTSTDLKKVTKGVAQIKPSNVYEDISRRRSVVTMVFVTQCILIAFVVTDIYDTDTQSCRDGSSDCPIVGTLGSWGFYVLGIFMACVYLVGPKTSFGQSEQNPAYWLHLLLSAKSTGSKVVWTDHNGVPMTWELAPGDWRLWLRFFMSFLINGVGFHILVHALPIQVASQSSFTGVVFRAVGMMYLVDLDDTPGYTLTVVEGEEKQDPTKPITKDESAMEVDNRDVAAAAAVIIADAQNKLDALAASHGMGSPNHGRAPVGGLTAGAALAMAAGVRDPGDGQGGEDEDAGGEEDGGAEIDA
jgi:hypothetical protein